MTPEVAIWYIENVMKYHSHIETNRSKKISTKLAENPEDINARRKLMNIMADIDNAHEIVRMIRAERIKIV